MRPLGSPLSSVTLDLRDGTLGVLDWESCEAPTLRCLVLPVPVK